MRDAGERDTLIGFYSVTTEENSFGEPVESGTTLIGQLEWAQVIYGKGEERRAAAIERANQAATFITLANDTTAAITTGNIIKIDGQAGLWDIVSSAPWKREEIEFTAIRRSP